MSTFADALIDAMGGTTKVSVFTKAPLSTVHSWRTKGLTGSRLDHLRRVIATERLDVDVPALARAHGVAVGEGEGGGHGGDDAGRLAAAPSGIDGMLAGSAMERAA